MYRWILPPPSPLELLVYGVGFHHAGMDISDRKTVEAMFTAGDLPVLCKTTAIPLLEFSSICEDDVFLFSWSLHKHSCYGCKFMFVSVYLLDVCLYWFCLPSPALQVNLPAHLVIVKSTMHYVGGMFQEYSESQILQMIGRAGRPQVCVCMCVWTHTAT